MDFATAAVSDCAAAEATAAAATAAQHPVDAMLRAQLAERTAPSAAAAQALGQGFDVRQRMELHILAQFRRPAVLPSARVGTDTLLGVDEDIDFCDVLGDPVEAVAPPDVHRAMETRLNL